MEFYTPSNSKSSLNDQPTTLNIQDEEAYLKRKFQEVFYLWMLNFKLNTTDEELNTNLKLRHVEIFAEEKDPISSFSDLDFPFFLGFHDEKPWNQDFSLHTFSNTLE